MVKGEGKCPFIQNIYKDDIYKCWKLRQRCLCTISGAFRVVSIMQRSLNSKRRLNALMTPRYPQLQKMNDPNEPISEAHH